MLALVGKGEATGVATMRSSVAKDCEQAQTQLSRVEQRAAGRNAPGAIKSKLPYTMLSGEMCDPGFIGSGRAVG